MDEEHNENTQSPESLTKQIEALLFYKAEPMKIEDIGAVLEVSEEDLQTALIELEKKLENRGVVLMLEGGVAQLGTTPEASELIEKVRKQEISGSLGKAALECLTVVLYRGPIARSDIDYLRGVNSQFILRRLSIRGLVEQKPDPKNTRRVLYEPSLALLSHLGVTSLNDLPEYERVEEKFQDIFDQAPSDENETEEEINDSETYEAEKEEKE